MALDERGRNKSDSDRPYCILVHTCDIATGVRQHPGPVHIVFLD